MSDAPAASPAILLAMNTVTGVVDAVGFLAIGPTDLTKAMADSALQADRSTRGRS